LFQLILILQTTDEQNSHLRIKLDPLSHPSAHEDILFVPPYLLLYLRVLLNHLAKPLDALVIFEVLNSFPLAQHCVGKHKTSLPHMLPQDTF
jgi:hypothetical protein